MKRSLVKKIRDKVYSLTIGATIINSKIGYKAFVSKNAFISNSVIGDYTSVGRNTTIVHTQLGKYCSISWNVTIGATQHPLQRISSHAFPYIKRFGFVETDNRFTSKTSIGNDVWFGANSIVLPNISIGNGAVVGAGSVVTKDVPDFAIVAGIPAKIIKFRFGEEQVTALNAIQWWNLRPELIRENISLWQKDLDDEGLSRLKELSKC